MKEKMTLLNQYAVVTLHREEDEFKMFLTPGAYLEAHTSPYTNEGWKLYCVHLCNQEDYLNERVDDLMLGYNETLAEREALHRDYRLGLMGVESYLTALNITHELEMSDLRRLHSLMNRIRHGRCVCRNEDAVELYNKVF